MPDDSPVTLPPQRPLLTFRGIALRLALCWLIYTLSIGPMYWTWFGAAYVSGPYWVIAFYSPLQTACEYVPYYGDFVEGYIWWWNFPTPAVIADPGQQLVAG